MSAALSFSRITDARANMKAMYDSAERHVPALVHRESDEPVALVRRDDLRRALEALCPLDPQVRFSDGGAVSMWIDGLPVSAEAADFEASEVELVAALRDYAETWVEENWGRFPEHERNWGVVNLALVSDDEQLRAHLFESD